MKLQKMTDFVLNTLNPENFGSSDVRKVINYAKFLQQPLTLGMFVACDEDGNVLEMPKCFGKGGGWNCACSDALMQLCTDKTTQYRKAKEKVLFINANYRVTDGKVHKITIGDLRLFEKAESVANKWVLPNHKLKTIEDLLQSEHEIDLTESALKQIEINDASNSSK